MQHSPLYFRTLDALSVVKCDPYAIVVEEPAYGIPVIKAALWRQDTDTGQWGWGYSGPYMVEDYMSDDVIAKRFFVACRDYSEHEVREAWEYKGERVLGPHVSLDSLHHLLAPPTVTQPEPKADDLDGNVKMVLWLQKWTESEAGWGQRPDGYSLHLRSGDRDKYVADYWERMPDSVPTEYSFPDGNAIPVTVPFDLYTKVAGTEFGARFYDHATYETAGSVDV